MKSIIWVASRRDGDRCAERWVTLRLGKSQSPTKIHGKVCTLETLWFSIDIIGSMNFYWVPQIGVSKIHIRVMDCCYQSIDLSEASGSLCPQSEKTCVPTQNAGAADTTVNNPAASSVVLQRFHRSATNKTLQMVPFRDFANLSTVLRLLGYVFSAFFRDCLGMF